MAPIATTLPRLPEHRREPRVYTTLEAELCVGGKTHPARIQNVSLSGAYVELNCGDDIEEASEVWLYSPALGESTPTEVRHKRVFDGELVGVGLQFREPSIGVRNRIRRLVEMN